MLGSFLFTGDDAQQPAGTLSGGEKTRLALADWWCPSANVLLLDEPTNNLDPASREEVLGALRSLRGAIVLVTHDEGAVEALDPSGCCCCPTASRTTGAPISPTWSRWPENLSGREHSEVIRVSCDSCTSGPQNHPLLEVPRWRS